MPFFVTRRIIEGLGLGLARRAARKLVPVVLTLGSGPSSFPRKFSRQRLKLPRQPGRGASLALASVILALGACPLGFPKQLSGRRPKLPRQPWQTRAVARARSVILALGAGPSGFPKQFSGQRPKLLRQPPSRSLPSFWRWGVAGRASRNKFPSDATRRDLGRRQPWQTRAVALFWRWGLARRASRNNFPGEASATAMANPRRRSRALRYFGVGGLARRASRNKFPSDAKRGDLGGRCGICGPKPMSMLQHGPRLSRARISGRNGRFINQHGQI